MKSSNSFFVIQNVNKGDNGKLSVAGQFIINGNTEVVSSPGSQPEDKQPKVTIELPRMFEVKWILPPRGSWAYDAVKGAAENMGYETVENDDFTYPGR
jgi:hypothetical protein